MGSPGRNDIPALTPAEAGTRLSVHFTTIHSTGIDISRDARFIAPLSDVTPANCQRVLVNIPESNVSPPALPEYRTKMNIRLGSRLYRSGVQTWPIVRATLVQYTECAFHIAITPPRLQSWGSRKSVGTVYPPPQHTSGFGLQAELSVSVCLSVTGRCSIERDGFGLSWIPSFDEFYTVLSGNSDSCNLCE